MTLERLITPFYWERWSKKVRQKIERPHFVGLFTPEEALQRGMRLVVGRRQGGGEGIALYWLVDEGDGVIADLRFQLFGPPALLAALEGAAELILRKNYDQVSRFSAELIDQALRDRKELPALPKECAPHFNQVLEAIDDAVQQCSDIPFTVHYEATPLESLEGEIPGGLPGWEGFSLEERQGLIEGVLEREIRPYVELDAGGVRLASLTLEGEVKISYEGSCTSCHASTGSTLTAIQQILRARVHPSLFVVPVL